MFLGEYIKYNSHYVTGAKKIVVRTTRPKISRESGELQFERSVGNFDLYFSKLGVLHESAHWETDQSFKITYGYSSGKRVIATMKKDLRTMNLLSTGEFIYDKEERIVLERSKKYYRDSSDSVREFSHFYRSNTSELFMPAEDEDSEDHSIFSTYDNSGREIEEKAIRAGEELIYWYKRLYGADGNLMKETSVDEFENILAVYDFMPYINGLATGRNCKSLDENWVQHYNYTFNERNHWINEVILWDGEPKFICDRIIEYY